MGDPLCELDSAVTLRALCVGGHFGELLQGRLGPNGPLALVSLPCADLALHARIAPAAGLHIHTSAAPMMITPARARRFLAQLGLRLSGRVTLAPMMPVGAGAGSSTAALVALARLAGWNGTDKALARSCVWAEGASDPLMLARPAQTLWASREGRVLRDLPPLPDFDILGGFWGAGGRTDAADLHFPDIAPLIPAWARAAEGADLATLAQLATTSAQMTLALRGGGGEPIFTLADRLGALGVVIAHTGSARGLIFARGAVPAGGRAALVAAGMSRPLMFRYRGK